MIHFIYGPCGSGKTTTLYKYLEIDAKQGKKAFFIVPEQETVAVERAIVSLLPYSSQLNVDVLNFSRLCNKIFRTCGGLSYNTATKTVKSLLMWNTVRELASMLEEYKVGDPSDFSLTQKMLSASSELKAYSVSPQRLERATEKIDPDSSLYAKLRDISLIYSAYTSQLNDKFSDNADDISKALEMLQEYNFFKDCNVYLDSFAGFTKQEMDFIRRISELCDDLYITLPLPTPNDSSIHLESLRQTDLKLKKHLDKSKFDETYLTEIKRTHSEELIHLQSNLWNFHASEYNGSPKGTIKTYICETPYSESDIVASEICREVQNGAKYSDIAIVLRDAEKYKGILDTALDKYGIPFFMSEKTDLMAKALSKYIFSALKIKENNWRASDVIAHIKSGFCDVDPFDVDIFEDYVYTWNINGNKFFDEKWTMNPDGYSAKLSARGERIIKIANEVKGKIIPLLSLYFSRLDASTSVKEMCVATIEFLKDSNVTNKVRRSCEINLNAGNKKEADEDMKLYSLTLNILYELSSVLGDKALSFTEFSAALNLMFTQSDIGTIPTSADEVTVGSASMLRTGNVKIAFIMGLNEGEFPAAIKDNGIFTDNDKEILEELDLSLSSSTNIKTSEELFFVYRALSAPSEKAILTRSALSSDGSAQRQSIVLERVRRLLPDCDIIKESTLSPVDTVWNTDSAKSFYSKFRFSKNADKLRDVLIAQGDNYAFLENLDIPLSQKSCTVSPEIAKNLFGNRLSLTQSRLEKYVLCGFDYYCTYVLGLRESKRAVFQLNDIGTFIHYILEMFMKEISDDGKINLSLSDAEIESILQRTVEKYLFELLGENYALSNRTKHLFDRLNKLSYMIVKNLIDEFKSSDFIPSQFELKVGMGDEGIKALEFKLKDGSTVSLRGIADRVDTYKKDDKIYIRVVDYKTGSKEFSFDDLKEGLNTQLLIYLFSICKSNDQISKDIFGLNENDTFVPAGIQYLSSNAPVISIDSFCEKDMVDKMIQGEFSRSGILTDDPEILRAINHDLDSAIVSKFKEDSEGNLIGKSLMSNDGFEEIYSMLSETIINVAQSMKDGKANAVPLRKGEKAPCRYCKMKSVCRASVCKSKI